MPNYQAVLVGNVSDRWTKKGREQEMAALSSTLSNAAQEGWRLHSMQPVPTDGLTIEAAHPSTTVQVGRGFEL
jgi:hypothetical protein